MHQHGIFRAGSLVLLVLLTITTSSAWGFEAGSAKVEITPALGSPLNGEPDRLGRGALAVHDPLWARCLYLSDGTNTAFLVSADLYSIPHELRSRVLELISPEIKPESVILTATHTHNAQGGMTRNLLLRPVSGRYVPELVDQAAKGISEAMRLAYEGRKRGAIGYTVYDSGNPSSKPPEPTETVKPTLGLIRVDDPDGNPISVLVNTLLNPTSLRDADHYALSADFPGVFCKAMEETFGTGCVPLFLYGAEGSATEAKTGWEAMENAGHALAEKVHPALLQTKCADVKLHIGYATPTLPLSVSGKAVPETAIIHTLEIGDLLLAFAPGEPSAEMAIELRTRAQQRGYANAFLVGLANEYAGSFVAQANYGLDSPETRQNFSGPHMADWFYAEVGKMMTKGKADIESPAPAAATVATLNAEDGSRIPHILLQGTPRTTGYQRGAAFKDRLAQKFKEDIIERLDSGTLLPEKSLWRTMSPYLDLSPVTIRMLCLGSRPLMQNLTPTLFDEITGMAEGAHMPFDAIWLLQCTPTFAAQPNMTGLFAKPYCTLFALTGDRAGADEILVGRNLDWENAQDEPVVIEVKPDTGHRFVQVGFSWNVGVFSGMNDAGLVLCVERNPAYGTPAATRTPVELLLRDLLQNCNDMDAAVSQLQAQTGFAGYNILVAGPTGGFAAVITYKGAPAVRAPVSGLLLATDPAEPGLEANSAARYGRVRDLTASEHIVSAAKLRTILTDRQGDLNGTGTIWNEQTRYSVIFEPKQRTLHVAVRHENGTPGNYASLTLEHAAETIPVPAKKPVGIQKRKASQ